MLENSQYAEFLRKINDDLSYEITDMHAIGDKKMVADIIIKRQDSIEKLELVIIREEQVLKIYDEMLNP